MLVSSIFAAPFEPRQCWASPCVVVTLVPHGPMREALCCSCKVALQAMHESLRSDYEMIGYS